MLRMMHADQRKRYMFTMDQLRNSPRGYPLGITVKEGVDMIQCDRERLIREKE